MLNARDVLAVRGGWLTGFLRIQHIRGELIMPKGMEHLGEFLDSLKEMNPEMIVYVRTLIPGESR